MRDDFKKNLRIAIIALFVIGIISYGIFQSRNLLSGPQLTIFESVPEFEKVILENSQRDGSIIGFRATIVVARDLFDFEEQAVFEEPVEEEVTEDSL